MSCDPDSTISAAEIANTKSNFETIKTVTESNNDTTTTPDGKTVDTVAGALKKLGWATPAVAYAGGVSFTVNDGRKVIERNSIIYAPLPSELPFTTSGTWSSDDEDKFTIISYTEAAHVSYDGSNVESFLDSKTKDFQNVAALKLANIAAGSRAKTFGYYTAGDGGGADYLIMTSVEYGSTPDGFIDHYVGGGTDYVAKLLHTGVINVRQAGAVGDWFDYTTGGANPSPTDDTAAIQAALDFATGSDGINGLGWSVYFPTSYYAISAEVKAPSVTQVYGDGRYNSILTALPGFTGVMLGDKGSAAKLYVHNLQVDTRDEAGVTDAIKMGYGVPFGTEGGMYELLLEGGLTDALANTNGLNVVGNVGLFHHISAIRFAVPFFEGPNSVANHFDNCVALEGKTYSFLCRTATKITNFHVESPASTSQPFRINSSCVLSQGTVSLGAQNVTDLITLPSGSEGVAVRNLRVILGSGSLVHVLNDQRPGSNQQYWADDAQKGNIYNFDDVFTTPVGTLGDLAESSNNILLNNQDASGGILLGSKRAGTLEYFISNASIGFDGPSVDNVKNLARASQRYTDAFFVNAPTVTSDARTKKNIQSIPQELLDFVITVEIKQYRLIENTSERYHYGIVVTDNFVSALNEVYSIDECAAICHELFTDEEGNPVSLNIGGVELGDIWQVRYGEWQNLLLEAMRRKL